MQHLGSLDAFFTYMDTHTAAHKTNEKHRSSQRKQHLSLENAKTQTQLGAWDCGFSAVRRDRVVDERLVDAWDGICRLARMRCRSHGLPATPAPANGLHRSCAHPYACALIPRPPPSSNAGNISPLAFQFLRQVGGTSVEDHFDLQ